LAFICGKYNADLAWMDGRVLQFDSWLNIQFALSWIEPSLLPKYLVMF